MKKPPLPDIPLGFEVGTGQPVAIPVGHMAVTGMTQQAGKTTALEALVARSGLRAITFITKRGEGSFAGGRRIPPFFRERADWVFVASLIDATLGEKNKMLRSFLMKVCRGTETLADVRVNVKEMQGKSRGFAESIYTEIDGYLDLVVPQLEQLPPPWPITIWPGLNVVDLSDYSTELQALVIKSFLEHVYGSETDVITVIPEAWEFLPEGRGSPVKREAETLIRKGAALRNFVWLDSQDLAGVWKLAVRACPVYLIGVQREANEIKRTLDNIPASVAKPSKASIATLELGQFYACYGRHAIKTYVRPVWMHWNDAHEVAIGVLPHTEARKIHVPSSHQMDDELRDAIETIKNPAPGVTLVSHGWSTKKEPTVTEAEAEALTRENVKLVHENKQLRADLMNLTARFDALELKPPAHQMPEPRQPLLPAGSTTKAASAELAMRRVGGPLGPPADLDEEAYREALFEALYMRIVNQAATDPLLLKVIATKPELHVQVTRKTVTIDGDTPMGRTAALIAEGFFDGPRTAKAAFTELKRRGFTGADARIYEATAALHKKGFLSKESDGFLAVAGMKVNIMEA